MKTKTKKLLLYGFLTSLMLCVTCIITGILLIPIIGHTAMYICNKFIGIITGHLFYTEVFLKIKDEK